eukprot:Gb_30499 [translate_table: standard]
MEEEADIGALGVVSNGPYNDHEHHSDDGHIRTGDVWTASAHVITAVIGSGVLSLAWSVAQLGWLLGPLVLLAFSFVTYYTSILLADCYRSPDPVTGRRNHTYMEAVKTILVQFSTIDESQITVVSAGRKKVMLCGIAQYSNLYGTMIGYTVTAATSIMAIKKSDCFHEKGHHAPCYLSGNVYMTIFGVLELILSQLPSLEKISWLSIVAAVMSFAYSLIGLGLSIAKAAGIKHSSGTLTGVPISAQVSPTMKTWYAFQALGNIAFAYTFSMDTIKSPPEENRTMKKATLRGISITTLFYMSLGCIGYAAFGNNAPGNMLTGFGFYEPFWLIDIGNLCIVIHLLGAYQVYSQPLFAFLEDWVSHKWKTSGFVHRVHRVKIPFLGLLCFTILSLVLRSLLVVSATLIAMIFPFFNDIMGLVGALGFWPLTVYYPVEMYMVQTNVKSWSGRWIFLQSLSLVCFLVTLAAIIGSTAGIAQDLKHVTPFKTQH